MEPTIQAAFEMAIELAGRYAGATAPNPCVGAAALDGQGRILSVQAHERAGEPHAEARVIAELERIKQADTLPDTLVVTLEPCNHQGRTGPCTEAIIRAGFRRVIYGAKDPNPRVAGGGAAKLRAAGIEVVGPDALPGSVSERCRELIRSFARWSTSGLPWVTIKTALNLEGTMIPPKGQKTFTSADSLTRAHELRKRADAILTGSGTILADLPEFTVRHVPDHPGKLRWLAILDRRRRTPEAYITRSKQTGFKVYQGRDIAETLQFLGSEGVLEVLVEAGPTLSGAIIEGGFWNQHVLIKQHPTKDVVEVRFRDA